MQLRHRHAFTLVEVLIVVVILGILSSIVVSNLRSTSTDAKISAAQTELRKLRRALEVYRVRNSDALPPIEEGNGTWGPIVAQHDYLKEPPRNPYVGTENAIVIVLGESADSEYTTEYGWIYNQNTGEIWAAGFDSEDQPHDLP